MSPLAPHELPQPGFLHLPSGLRLRYRTLGPADGGGPSVLFVHGIGCSLEDFEEQQALLSDVRTHAVDLPGFGSSDRLASPTTLAALARELLAFLDAVGESGPVHVVGNSLGGAVVMEMGVARPDRVRSMLLADPVGFGRTVTWALRVLAVRPVAARALVPSAARARRTLRGIFADPALVTPARIETVLRRGAAPHRAEVFVEVLDALGTWRGVRARWRADLLGALAPLELPTLVVWGERDRILPAAHLARVPRLLPHARTHLFAGTGHMPQIERAREFADLSRAFWAQVEAEPARAAGLSGRRPRR